MNLLAKQASMPPELKEALKIALRKLRASDRLQLEIETHLDQKGFSKGIISETIAYLKERGILNDARALTHLIERSKEQCEGRNKLRARLIAKGLAESPSELVASSRTDQEEAELAAQLARKAREEKADRQKAFRRLTSKGFDPEFAEAAVLEVFGHAPDGDGWSD